MSTQVLLPMAPPRPAAGPTFWLTLAAVLLGNAAPASAARHYDPFDEGRILTPDDVATLGLEGELRGAPEIAPSPLRLTPGAMLMLETPTDGKKPTLNGMLQVDTTLRRGRFGAQATPRLRLADATAPLQKSFVMLQQAFVFFRAGSGEIKLGKVLAQFGRMWDYGTHGPLIASADAKVSPEVGVSFELTQPLVSALELEVVGQFFPVDGRTFSVRNESLFSTAKARRRNIAGLRVVPVLCLGEARAGIGLSGQHFTAEAPAPHQVWRGAADFALEHPHVGAFVEVGRQAGDDINSENTPIASFSYLWTGLELRRGAFKARYHFNIVRYGAPYPGVDVLHQPGFAYQVTPTVALILEGALWRTSQNALPRGERNLYLVAFFNL